MADVFLSQVFPFKCLHCWLDGKCRTGKKWRTKKDRIGRKAFVPLRPW